MYRKSSLLLALLILLPIFAHAQPTATGPASPLSDEMVAYRLETLERLVEKLSVCPTNIAENKRELLYMKEDLKQIKENTAKLVEKSSNFDFNQLIQLIVVMLFGGGAVYAKGKVDTKKKKE